MAFPRDLQGIPKVNLRILTSKTSFTTLIYPPKIPDQNSRTVRQKVCQVFTILPQFQDLRTRGSESAKRSGSCGMQDLVSSTSNLSARKSHRLRERSGHEFVGST
ncbi:MAG: hypothetical protein ACYTXE_32645 [Nostoc sp.]